MVYGRDPAADQHAARQARPAGRLRHPPGGDRSTGCRTRRRCRRRPPRATRSSRSRAAAGEVRSLQEWHALAREMSPGMDRVTARDPALRPALRGRAAGAGARGRAARRATRPTGSAGPATVLLPADAEDVASGAARWRTRPACRGSPSGSAPTSCCRTRASTPWSSAWARGSTGCSRTAIAGRSAPGCPRPSPRAARRRRASPGCTSSSACPGTVGGGVFMNAGCHGGDWAEVVERVTVVDGAGQDSVLDRADDPVHLSPERAGRPDRAGERPCGSAPRSRPQLDEQIAEMFEWRQRGTPFNQPCCGSVFKNPSGPSWKREGGPRTAGQLIEAAGLKGSRSRRRPGVADARELLREHRRRHRGRRPAR